MAQLPLIRQNQVANAHVDGATPSYLPTSINQPNQNMPHRSELSQGHRWRNSFYTIQIRAISPYIQAKMIGNVVNLVNNTLISIYWSGSCAIYLSF